MDVANMYQWRHCSCRSLLTQNSGSTCAYQNADLLYMYNVRLFGSSAVDGVHNIGESIHSNVKLGAQWYRVAASIFATWGYRRWCYMFFAKGCYLRWLDRAAASWGNPEGPKIYMLHYFFKHFERNPRIDLMAARDLSLKRFVEPDHAPLVLQDLMMRRFREIM